MDKLAAQKHPGTIYEGIAYEGEQVEIRREVPDGGKDIQDHPVYWTLPHGATVCWNLRELADARPYELQAEQSDAAYKAIADEMHFDVLGVCDEPVITRLRDDPGNIAEKKWDDGVLWTMPEKETAPCWWLQSVGATASSGINPINWLNNFLRLAKDLEEPDRKLYEAKTLLNQLMGVLFS